MHNTTRYLYVCVSLYPYTRVLMLVCMCPYAFCVCHTQDSSVRVGNLLYGDIRYVNGGVRVTVTRLKDGDEVSGDEEDETNEKTKKKQGGKKKVIL